MRLGVVSASQDVDAEVDVDGVMISRCSSRAAEEIRSRRHGLAATVGQKSNPGAFWCILSYLVLFHFAFTVNYGTVSLPTECEETYLANRGLDVNIYGIALSSSSVSSTASVRDCSTVATLTKPGHSGPGVIY